MIIIGIDPGKSGGIAWALDGQLTPHAVKMPETVADIVEMLQHITDGCQSEHVACYLENVHAMPSQGVTSMFTFGEGFGVLQGALAALQIPYEFVNPQAWQKLLGIPKGNKADTATVKKNKLKAKAQELFPSQKWTLSTCDAALICEYGRRQKASQP